jgi:hypothetical protein
LCYGCKQTAHTPTSASNRVSKLICLWTCPAPSGCQDLAGGQRHCLQGPFRQLLSRGGQAPAVGILRGTGRVGTLTQGQGPLGRPLRVTAVAAVAVFVQPSCRQGSVMLHPASRMQHSLHPHQSSATAGSKPSTPEPSNPPPPCRALTSSTCQSTGTSTTRIKPSGRACRPSRAVWTLTMC